MRDQRALSNAMLETMVAMGRHAPSAVPRGFGSAYAMVTGLPLLSFNTMWIVDEPRGEDVVAALGYLKGTGYPYSANLVHGLDDQVVPALSDAGMEQLYETPLMVCDTPRTATWPTELLRVDGPTTLGAHRGLIIDAFNLNPDHVETFVSEAAFNEPDLTAVVGFIDGRPVTTAVGVMVGNTLGVFNVATDVSDRGKGYGAAATAAIVEGGFDAGATRAILQSSEIGVSVYESLGFETVAMHDRWGYRDDPDD